MLRVNGVSVSPADPDATLLSVIRDTLGLVGTKQSCGRGECGACTVLLDDRPVMACIQLAAMTQGAVTTIEGLAEEALPLRQAFAEFGGFQCGYCTAGQIVHATAVLREIEDEGEDEAKRIIRHRMSGNICRCTGYGGIVEAVWQAHRRRVAGPASAPAGLA